MRSILANGVCVLAVLASAAFAVDSKPPQSSPEAKRAFDDLGAFYAANAKKPDFVQALKDLSGADAAKRKSSGAYLLALFKQSFDDETNGRAPVKRSPFFGGGGTNSDARVFRQELAAAFGKDAQCDEALDAVLWLLDEERLAVNQAQGLEALKKIKTPKSVEIFRKLLAQPHPVAAVAKGAIEAAADRGMKELAPEIKTLCVYYRTSVREAARAAAPKVGIAAVPEYKPEAAFTPWLEGQLQGIASMVAVEIPKDAKWTRFTLQEKDNAKEFSGWLLSVEKDGSTRAVDWFGEVIRLPKLGVKTAPRAIADDAKELLAVRNGGSKLESLSRMGGATYQFEPKAVSVPEALVGAWCLKSGDKASAAALLFPRIDQMADDRWLLWMVRDMIGPARLQEMLEAYTYDRDYPKTLALAQHLAKPAFEEFTWQKRARMLAEQLARRGDDFNKLALPKPAEWDAMKKNLKRDEQVKFLAERLRLLNCIQMGQPGDVNYADPQTAEASRKANGAGTPVINPYNELRAMNLQPSELPALVPSLADENFMLAFSYWRDFHPKRTLHQVNWAVAGILDEAAKKRLSDLGAYALLDDAGKKQHLDKILDWCKANAGKTRDQLPDELPKQQQGGPRIDAP